MYLSWKKVLRNTPPRSVRSPRLIMLLALVYVLALALLLLRDLGLVSAQVTTPAQDALATIARQVGGRGLFRAFDGTQFGTMSGDNEGGGKLCFGDAASGVSGSPDCDINRQH